MSDRSRPSARWGAACDDCGALTTIDGDGKSLPDPGEWEEFPRCMVCGGTLYMDEELTSQWERETWLMREARKSAWDQCHKAIANAPWPADNASRAYAAELLLSVRPAEAAS